MHIFIINVNCKVLVKFKAFLYTEYKIFHIMKLRLEEIMRKKIKIIAFVILTMLIFGIKKLKR